MTHPATHNEAVDLFEAATRGLPHPENFLLVASTMKEFTGFAPRSVTWMSLNHYEAETSAFAPGHLRDHYTFLIRDGEAIRQN